MKKLDPELRSRLRAQRLARLPGAAPAAPARVGLLVEFTGPIEDLVAVGFEPTSVTPHPTAGYSIASGTIAVEKLEALAAIPHVVQTEGPRQYHPQLDYSVPEVHADVLHRADPPDRYRGAGVVVGVIDTGIEWRHGAFINPAGNHTRILAIWDQTPSNAVGTTGPGAVGIVVSEAEINAALAGTGTVHKVDTNGHGTHVAGIAAGNGLPASCCSKPSTYVGVAPEADIIAVGLKDSSDELGSNTNLVNAIDFIFNHPSAAGKGVVINISLGDNLGPHDGTTPAELQIDAVVATAGRAVVVSAGNHANERCHVTGTVPAKTAAADSGVLEIEFEVPESTGKSYLDLWYARAGAIDLEVVAPGPTTGAATHGNDTTFVANPGASAARRCSVEIDGTINGVHDRDNNFRVKLNKPTSGHVPMGAWKLRLKNQNNATVAFHCWIERGTPAPKFLPAVSTADGKVRSSSDSTVSCPGTARGAITVANYRGKEGSCDCCVDDVIDETSGRGPVTRNAGVNPKPNLAAPGTVIMSAKADAANLKGNCCDCCSDDCCCLYEDMSGTSMAAPHVTGAIALMLQKNKTLTKDEILTHLVNTVRARPTDASANEWGAGLLNVQAAVEDVIPGPAAGAGTGGGTGAGAGGGKAHTAPARMPAPLLPVLRSPPSREPALPPLARFVPLMMARVRALPSGIELAAAVSRHFSEVRRLINNNRRIATMWHRGQGPRLLKRVLAGAFDPEERVPLPGGREREYLERCLDQLVRFGSPKLKHGITRHREHLLLLLSAPLAAHIAARIPGAAE